jgi:predicted nucleic acid-binding Zn ribbon protein
MRSIGRDPVFVARGEGAELIDVDGNRYVDWVMSWGPLIAGHAHPRDLRDGTLTIAVDAPPWATELRYLEADICARFRAITGRDAIQRVRVVVERPR